MDDFQIRISTKHLKDLIDAAVKESILDVLPFINQSMVIDKITKALATQILGYKTTNSLKRLKDHGKRFNDGYYYYLKPIDGTMYSFKEVMAFKKLELEKKRKFGY